MLSVPGAKTVRGYSFFGDSFVYVLFDDKTDPYWARSRVVEYLNQVQSRLPAGATAALGPGRDRRGLGLRVRAGRPHAASNDLGQLRALQRLVPEVRAEDGARRGRGGQHRRHGAGSTRSCSTRTACARSASPQAMVDGGAAEGQPGLGRLGRGAGRGRVHGALARLPEVARRLPRHPAVGVAAPTPVLLRDVATVQIGPEMRRGIAELDGEGEVAGGVVVMRSGKNARTTIEAVKAKLEALQAEPAAGRRGGGDLRPLAAHRPRRRQPARQARRGVHRRRAGVRGVPVPPALGAGGGRRAAGRRAGGVRRDALAGRQREHPVARAASPSRSARWSMRRSCMVENAHKHLEALRARSTAGEPTAAERWDS